MQVIRVVSYRAFLNPFQVKWRPIKAIRIVPAAPMPAASVGVKNPANKPPMTRTNKIKVSISPDKDRNFSPRCFWDRAARFPDENMPRSEWTEQKNRTGESPE